MFHVMVKLEPAVSDIFGSEGWRTVCATPKVRAAMTSATRPALAISLSLFNALFTDLCPQLKCLLVLAVMGKPTEGPQVPPPWSPSLVSPGGWPGHGGNPWPGLPTEFAPSPSKLGACCGS